MRDTLLKRENLMIHIVRGNTMDRLVVHLLHGGRWIVRRMRLGGADASRVLKTIGAA